MISSAKKPKSKTFQFFSLQSKRFAISFEHLNSSLAHHLVCYAVAKWQKIAQEYMQDFEVRVSGTLVPKLFNANI